MALKVLAFDRIEARGTTQHTQGEALNGIFY